MKKLMLFFMALLVFNVSFAKEKIDTTFTFQGYSPTSSSSIRVSPRTKITKNSKISYPSFIGGANSDIVKNMNAIMENFISRYKSTKHVSYSTSYEVTAENSLFLSVLFTINLTDNDTGQKTVLHNAISYNLKSGKQLQLKDLFVDGFNSELTDVVNSRFKQFGLPQIDKLDDKIADTLTNTQLGVHIEEKVSSIERISPYVHGTIDDLLLQAIQAHNAGKLERAISIYTEIIDSKPAPSNVILSIILKHRGMAYFIKNDYDHALADFQQSFVFDANSFQSKYYEGIVHTIQKNYEAAVHCFDLSLELNTYQSHAYYRRAIALFELHEYEKSMGDVVVAKNLGLEEKGLDCLHEKLLKKFDML